MQFFDSGVRKGVPMVLLGDKRGCKILLLRRDGVKELAVYDASSVIDGCILGRGIVVLNKDGSRFLADHGGKKIVIEPKINNALRVSQLDDDQVAFFGSLGFAEVLHISTNERVGISLKSLGIAKPGRQLIKVLKVDDSVYICGAKGVLVRVDGDRGQSLLPRDVFEEAFLVGDACLIDERIAFVGLDNGIPKLGIISGGGKSFVTKLPLMPNTFPVVANFKGKLVVGGSRLLIGEIGKPWEVNLDMVASPLSRLVKAEDLYAFSFRGEAFRINGDLEAELIGCFR